MTIRCKFSVWSVTENKHNEGMYDVQMGAVTSGSEENEQYWKWTPAGQFTMSTINEAAAKQLEVGKAYYIDITPAE